MSTSTLHQSPFPYHHPEAISFGAPAVDLLTTEFLNSAAALEHRLLETERSNQSLKNDNQVLRRELRRAWSGQIDARVWIKQLRYSHRNASHRATNLLFQQALDKLDYQCVLDLEMQSPVEWICG